MVTERNTKLDHDQSRRRYDSIAIEKRRTEKGKRGLKEWKLNAIRATEFTLGRLEASYALPSLHDLVSLRAE